MIDFMFENKTALSVLAFMIYIYVTAYLLGKKQGYREGIRDIIGCNDDDDYRVEYTDVSSYATTDDRYTTVNIEKDTKDKKNDDNN